jgi:hypothetical protein
MTRAIFAVHFAVICVLVADSWGARSFNKEIDYPMIFEIKKPP